MFHNQTIFVIIFLPAEIFHNFLVTLFVIEIIFIVMLIIWGIRTFGY